MPVAAEKLLLPWIISALLLGVALLYALLAPLFQLPPARLRSSGPKWGTRLFALSLITAGLYARFVEPYELSLEQQTLRSGKLKSPLRLVLVSDLHAVGDGRVAKLAEIIPGLSPDLILVAGDFLDSPEGRPELEATLRRLAEVAPLYGVLGNHDRPEDLLAGLPIRLLDGEALPLSLKGNSLWLGGAAFWHPSEGKALSSLQNASGYRIFLHHAPDRVDQAEAAGVDLYLCGHTHGGQLRLPFYGALVTFAESGKRFEAGRYQVGAMTVYVTRGVGTSFARLRFLAKPEVTVIDLEPAGP